MRAFYALKNYQSIKFCMVSAKIIRGAGGSGSTVLSHLSTMFKCPMAHFRLSVFDMLWGFSGDFEN